MRRLLARAFILTLVCASSAATAWAQSGRVIGTVRDDHGQPIKGATVTADNPDAPGSFTATSDDKGRFGMIGLRSGNWSLTASAPGHAPLTGDINVRQSANSSAPIVFTLKKLVAPPSILGTVAVKDLQQELSNADQLFDNQRWDESIAAYRTILGEAPALSAISLQIAAAYRNKRDFDTALATYNELLRVDPSNDKARIGIAMVDIEKGDVDAAERILETAAQSPGVTREVFYNLGDVKLSKSKSDEAFKAYERAAAADPIWGKPAYALGRLSMTKGDSESATKYFTRVIDVDPTSPEAAQARAALDQLKR